MQKNMLLPIYKFVSQQSFLTLCRNNGFCDATGFGLDRVFLGRDKGFLGRDRAFWLYVTTWFSLCHDMVFNFKQ